MTTFLSVSVLLCCLTAVPLQAGERSQPSRQSATVVDPSAPSDPEILRNNNLDSIAIDSVAQGDHTCFKIRAFVFKTSDDRVPEFVRETTCLRSKTSAKKVQQLNPPKLVPSN